jgi:hypothetical protein
MGTNYYWYPEPDCPCCGRNEEGLHIGKSGYGWAFSLHVGLQNSHIPSTIVEWKELFNRKNSIIKDEYGNKVSVEYMLEIILKREGYTSAYHELRHHPLGDHCVAHFDTYDHCIGWFA